MDVLVFLGSMNGETSRQELTRAMQLATHAVTNMIRKAFVVPDLEARSQRR
jgi:hypothetical protein